MRWYQHLLLIFLLFMLQRPALAFNSGSNGSFGPLVVDVGFGVQTILDLPPDGIIHATTITIAPGNILKFNRNALNTPVYLLATGDIIIDGGIDVSSSSLGGTHTTGGLGGPGGFDGGQPGITPGAGYGPGAGLGGSIDDPTFTGNAGHRTPGGVNPSDGQAYGSDLLMPIIGGSGGGAVSGQVGFGTTATLGVCGGGGGGGAIVIASDTLITIGSRVSINATGGGWGGRTGQCPTRSRLVGGGSAGAIRLVAPVISSPSAVFSIGNALGIGSGRVRIDAIDRKQFTVFNSGVQLNIAYGTFMQVFPPIIPHLDITDVAGQAILVGTATPVSVTLPFNNVPPTPQTVTVQATDFTGIVPIRVVFTPDSGTPIIVDGQIDMSLGIGNTGETTLTVDLPQNVVMRVNAWTL